MGRPWFKVRIGRGAWAHALVYLAALTGCELVPALDEESQRDDGERCTQHDECRSGFCTTAELCAHSACECQGNTCGQTGMPSGACQEDWVCLDADSIFDPVEEFFGGHPRKDKGYCQMPCDVGCPEHYYCAGTMCQPDIDWNRPVPTVSWSGDSAGTVSGKGQSMTVPLVRGGSVELEGSAVSPSDHEITSYRWQLVSSRTSEMVDGQSVAFTIDMEESFRRAELLVSDAQGRSSTITVVFEACFATGDTCGYEGSGCCNGCDRTTNTCL